MRLVVEFGKASTSLLQRRLRIGYGRAAHLIDLMEQDGIVGAANRTLGLVRNRLTRSVCFEPCPEIDPVQNDAE